MTWLPPLVPASGSTINRRRWLQQSAVLTGSVLSWRLATAKSPSNARALRFAAAWQADDGYAIGTLLADLAHGNSTLKIESSASVPTRAHAVVREADGSLLSVARRPGDWLLRLSPDGQEQWLWIEPDRMFNGHVISSADGRFLLTTETDLANSQGLIGVRDVRSMEKVAEWPTLGMDPHQLLQDHDGSLMVANGGIPTQPETGRRKLRLEHMDSSVVRLQTRGKPEQSGAVQGQWTLQDPRLSLRHLAWGLPTAQNPQQRWLGIALQAEHEADNERRAAPVLAVWNGQGLQTVAAPVSTSLGGYGGDIAFTGQQWVVSCPRVNGIAQFEAADATARSAPLWAGLTPLDQAYSLAGPATGASQPHDPHSRVWVGGSEITMPLGNVANAKAAPSPASPWPRIEVSQLILDNHWQQF